MARGAAALVTSAHVDGRDHGLDRAAATRDPRLRGHQGQIDAAAAMRALLDGVEIRESHREGDPRVQDPYCIRCQPQVTGAAMDCLRLRRAHAWRSRRMRVTDNPLVLTEATDRVGR